RVAANTCAPGARATDVAVMRGRRRGCAASGSVAIRAAAGSVPASRVAVRGPAGAVAAEAVTAGAGISAEAVAAGARAAGHISTDNFARTSFAAGAAGTAGTVTACAAVATDNDVAAVDRDGQSATLILDSNGHHQAIAAD